MSDHWNQHYTGNKPTSSRNYQNTNYNNGQAAWNGYQPNNQQQNGMMHSQQDFQSMGIQGYAPNPWIQNQGYGYGGPHMNQHQGPISYGRNSAPQPKTSFNVNAVEFVPRTRMTPSPNMQQDFGGGGAGRVVVVDDRCQLQSYEYPNYIQPASMSSGHVQYDEFGNEFTGNENIFIPSMSVNEKINASPCQNSLQEIVVGLETLISDSETPLEVWASCIRDRLTAKNMNSESRKIAFQVINEMALGATPADFEYSVQCVLAKVVAFLSLEVPRIVSEALLPSMQSYHETREELDMDRKCNLLLFFAEIYSRVETDAGSKIGALGGALIDQISDVLKKADQVNDDVMAYVNYSLSMAGPHLDTAGAYDRVSDVLTRLTGYARGSQMISEYTKGDINRLVEMRENKWPSTIKKVYSNSALHLNDEERAFMEMQLNALERSDDTETESFDEDIMNEYGRFLDESEKDEEVAVSLTRKLEEEDLEKKIENLKVDENQQQK